MQADVQELKIVSDQFTAKYGKPYAQACRSVFFRDGVESAFVNQRYFYSRENTIETVSAKLMHKLSVQAPPKITVEKYLIEIARYVGRRVDRTPG